MAALGAEVSRTPEGAALTLVVMSNGGDTNAALDVAGLLLRRDVTIVTGPICASACANYLFLPAARRVVPEGSVVAFHGGMSEGFRARLRRELEAARRSPRRDAPEIAHIETALRIVAADLPRQAAMLRAIGADPNLFAFFDDIPLAPWRRNCRGPANHDQVLVFSPEALDRRGIAVDLWRGPRSDTELQARLKQMPGVSPMCFWHEGGGGGL
jgi:hypothetical protein